MKHLKYSTQIAAAPQQVWSTMLDPETYKEWTRVSWPDSHFDGQWKQGEKIRFISSDGSGTLASIVELRPYEYISARHEAILQKGGTEDRDSEAAKGWTGIMENYTFTHRNGGTELTVDIETNPAWEEMFNDGWPKALEALKNITEKV